MSINIDHGKDVRDTWTHTAPPVKRNHVEERFCLNADIKKLLYSNPQEFGYDYFGEFIFYRTYSRSKEDGTNESWADVVIRVTEGTFSIRKDWYKKCGIRWNENAAQSYARKFALSLFNIKWTPPGRGLWAMGTDYVYKRGSAALYNCAYVTIKDLPGDAHWLMDMLMNGVGVGFGIGDNFNQCLQFPNPDKHLEVVIGDDREGWCESVRLLLQSYIIPGFSTVKFNYSKIRKAGLLIKGFGGLSSGPEPLIQLHERIRKYCSDYIGMKNSETRLITDIINAIGCCVVAGNVRRSAEIAVGSIYDEVFLNLKNYDKYPERKDIGWMSNNSVWLKKTEDFAYLPQIAKRIIENGEPGFVNGINVKEYGRVGKKDVVREDEAEGINPCGEVPLESCEVCNLSETYPTRCNSWEDWLDACEHATFYCSTVALLPTHRSETNAVVARNRRIGVGLVDFSGWKEQTNLTEITTLLRKGYKHIRSVNKRLAAEAGVPESIRVTVVKPGGTVPKLAGRTSGIGHPTFIYTIRRVRIQNNSPIAKFLADHNVPYEKDKYSDNTLVFEFPIKQGPAKPASEVRLWEQAMNVVLIQREWADNAVSNTIMFNPETEAKEVESVIACIAPLVKSISMCPHSTRGAYEQMPEEGCSKEEYEKRLSDIKKMDWSKYSGTDGMDTKFCDGEACELDVQNS